MSRPASSSWLPPARNSGPPQVVLPTFAAPMWWDGGERAITAREKARIEEHGPSCFTIALVPATPAARWAAEGQPDPHGNHYACERAALTLGNLTDDELANAVYLHGNEQPSMADLVAGKALSGIVYLTAAKDRIRWLSRSLVAALAATGKQQVGEVQGDALREAAMAVVGHIVTDTQPAYDAKRQLVAALAARQPGAHEPVCSGGFVIGNGSGEKYMAWGQVGPEWVADRSAALWLVRRADAEALAAENEDAWLILPVERCALPPNGWACTLASGHEGPCPTIAAPPAQGIDLGHLWEPIKEAVHAALSVHVAAMSQKKREQVAVYVARQLRDGQRDAAPGVDRG